MHAGADAAVLLDRLKQLRSAPANGPDAGATAVELADATAFNSQHDGVAGRLARQFRRIADSTWDELEGLGLPTEPAKPVNQHSASSHYLFGAGDDADTTQSGS